MSMDEHALARNVSKHLATEARTTGDFWFVKLGAWRWVVGLPDYVLCVRGHFMALELKHPTDESSTVTRRQAHVLRCIARAGGTTAILRNAHDVLALVAVVRTGWRGHMGDPIPPLRNMFVSR